MDSPTPGERIAVLVPCYNEELTVGKVVRDFREQLPDATVYVFDNNSRDRTADEAREAGAVVVREKRQGKGCVLQAMFAQIDADYYVLVDGDDTYTVTFRRRQTIAAERLIDTIRGPKRLAARLARFDGAYLRFAGEVKVEHRRDGELIEEADDDGVWELMYFGHAR